MKCRGHWNPAAQIAFILGAQIAIEKQLDYVIVLQDDVRLGRDNWDECIFDEFFSAGSGKLNGGTIFSFSPPNTPRFKAFLKASNNRVRSGLPPTIIQMDTDSKGPSYSYANGALSVISVPFLRDHILSGPLLKNRGVWDNFIGHTLSSLYGENSLDVLVPIKCVISDCFDKATTTPQLKNWLKSGKVVGVHQIREEWIP